MGRRKISRGRRMCSTAAATLLLTAVRVVSLVLVSAPLQFVRRRTTYERAVLLLLSDAAYTMLVVSHYSHRA